MGKNSVLKTGKVTYLTANSDEDFKAAVIEWIFGGLLLLWLIYVYDGIEAKD